MQIQSPDADTSPQLPLLGDGRSARKTAGASHCHILFRGQEVGRLQVVDGDEVLAVSKVGQEEFGVKLEDVVGIMVGREEGTIVSLVTDEHKFHLVQTRDRALELRE